MNLRAIFIVNGKYGDTYAVLESGECVRYHPEYDAISTTLGTLCDPDTDTAKLLVAIYEESVDYDCPNPTEDPSNLDESWDKQSAIDRGLIEDE